MARIVVVGRAEQEIFLLKSEDCEIKKVHYTVGGAGINAATTLARYDHEVILFTQVATDAFGQAIFDHLDDETIDSSFVVSDLKQTGLNIIKTTGVNRAQEAAKNVQKITKNTQKLAENLDSSLLFAPKMTHFPARDLDLVQPDWVYIGGWNASLSELADFCQRAHALGAKIMFNPSIEDLVKKPKILEILPKIDVLVVNKKEAASLVPGVLLTELLSHLKNYCNAVIITDGEMGAIAAIDQEAWRLGTYGQIVGRDRTGVGDAFGAGFLAVFAESGDFKSALHFASANAAGVLKEIGPIDGIISDNRMLHPMPIQKISTDLKEENA